MHKCPRIVFGVAVLYFVFTSRGFAVDPVVVRENINTFTRDPVKLKKLRDAVAGLKDRKLDNSISWFTQAGIHDILPK